MITYKVMKVDESSGFVWYSVMCGCSTDKHMLNINFEYDKDAPGWMWIEFTKKLGWCSYWGSNKWHKNIWKRITGTAKMLFTGYIEVEESFILDGAEHIESFIAALNEGREKILNYKNFSSENKE